MSEIRNELSAADRLILIQTLNALPSAQFEELVFALHPPKGNIPNNPAPQSSRCTALLEWLESPIGPGIQTLEELLGKVIATTSQTAEKFIAFSISGKSDISTISEVQAFVALLRKKTGDNSIDVAFFREGSIKMMLSGSPEGLRKLQELFESGELDKIGEKVVQSVHYVDSHSTDARKTRLVEILKLKSERTYLRVNQNKSAIASFTAASVGNHRISKKEQFARARARARALAPKLQQAIRNDRARALPLALELVDILELATDGAMSLEYETFNSCIRARARARAMALKLENAMDLDHQLNLEYADLSDTNLRNVNFRKANLTEVNFSGADLTQADLTRANLTGSRFTGAILTKTVFGENSGITDREKRQFQNLGAIVLDPPPMY